MCLHQCCIFRPQCLNGRRRDSGINLAVDGASIPQPNQTVCHSAQAHLFVVLGEAVFTRVRRGNFACSILKALHPVLELETVCPARVGERPPLEDGPPCGGVRRNMSVFEGSSVAKTGQSATPRVPRCRLAPPLVQEHSTECQKFRPERHAGSRIAHFLISSCLSLRPNIPRLDLLVFSLVAFKAASLRRSPARWEGCSGWEALSSANASLQMSR